MIPRPTQVLLTADERKEALLALLPTLEVHHGRRRWRARFVSQKLEQQGGRVVLEARAQGATLEATFELVREAMSSELLLRVERRYRRAVVVHREALVFSVPKGVELYGVDRYYQLQKARSPLLIGVASPVALLLERGRRRIAWYGSPSLPRALWRPRRRQLELELDHRLHHPLRAFERCTRPLRAFPPPRRDLSTTRRRLGERVRAQGRFVLAPRVLVVAQRYPNGYAAALSFTDHADQSSADKLEAFAFGASGALKRGELGPRFAGFVNRGLRYTKTIFLAQARAYDRQFDDARYRKVLAELQRRGSEIGVHSPSGGADTPRRTRALLSAFVSAYRGRNWIDHQPYTNCEALSMHGLDPRSRWYVLPELRRAGFRYVWAVPDVGIRRGSLNMLRGRGAAARRAAVYRHPRLGGGKAQQMIAFRSAMLFAPRERFLRRFSAASLKRLVDERGLLIGHVYLDSHRPRGLFANRSLLRREPSGRYVLRKVVDALFLRLAALQRQRALWVTGVEALAHHLMAAQALTVGYRVDGKLGLRGVVGGLTLRIWALAGVGAYAGSGGRPAALSAKVDGQPATLSQGKNAAWELVLATKGRALIELQRAKGQLRASDRVTLEVRQ